MNTVICKTQNQKLTPGSIWQSEQGYYYILAKTHKFIATNLTTGKPWNDDAENPTRDLTFICDRAEIIINPKF